MAKEEIKYTAVGRRKRSAANVILTKGTGKVTINGVDAHEYLPYETLIIDMMQPLTITENEKNYDVIVNVKGGGFSGQTGAIRLGIARALEKANAENRTVLKANGLVKRDPRSKERKKYGLKKARRAPQFSKR